MERFGWRGSRRDGCMVVLRFMTLDELMESSNQERKKPELALTIFGRIPIVLCCNSCGKNTNFTLNTKILQILKINKQGRQSKSFNLLKLREIKIVHFPSLASRSTRRRRSLLRIKFIIEPVISTT